MKLINTRSMIRDEIALCRDILARPINPPYGRDIHSIAKLDPETASVEDIQATKHVFPGTKACGECGQQSAVLVQLGQDPDDEGAIATVCLPCLQKAVELATKGEG